MRRGKTEIFTELHLLFGFEGLDRNADRCDFDKGGDPRMTIGKDFMVLDLDLRGAARFYFDLSQLPLRRSQQGSDRPQGRYGFMAVMRFKCSPTTGMDSSTKLLTSVSFVSADSALNSWASFLWSFIMAAI